MPWYRTGTITVNNGSSSVAGTGTAWVSNAAAGQAILLGGLPYEIAGVSADGALALGRPYVGSNLIGAAYEIMPTQDYIRTLAAQVAALLNNFSNIQDTAGAGKFGAGTEAAPGLAFVADPNTGLYSEAADVLGLAAGGAKRLLVGASAVQPLVPVNEAPGAAVDSAATINLTAATGNRLHITGTTNITSVVLAHGARRNVVFAGALQLVHGPNLLCPGGRTIATRPGDRAVFAGDQGGVVYVEHYTRADGGSVLPDAPMRTNARTVAEDLVLASGSNGLSAGPVTVADGVTVTLQDRAAWAVA